MMAHVITDQRLHRKHNDNHSLYLYQLNCNSVYARLSELRLYLYSRKPDVFCLCETLTHSSTPSFVGYQSVWQHRPDGAGGGLGILIRDDVPFSMLSLVPFPQAKLEILCVRL